MKATVITNEGDIWQLEMREAYPVIYLHRDAAAAAKPSEPQPFASFAKSTADLLGVVGDSAFYIERE